MGEEKVKRESGSSKKMAEGLQGGNEKYREIKSPFRYQASNSMENEDQCKVLIYWLFFLLSTCIRIQHK